MELAIPILALGGLYFVSKQKTREDRENFTAGEDLPNTNVPNKNFMKNLLEYELSLFGKNSLTYDECVQLFYYT